MDFDIKKEIAVLSKVRGVSKELNIVSIGGTPAKYDIRRWDDEHKLLSEFGISLTEKEAKKLMRALEEEFKK